MSVRRLADEQPASFEFSPDNLRWAQAQIAKYPEGRQASAVIPLLWQAQKQHDYWLPKPAIEKVADMLGMPYIRVLEIATFYTMFNLFPVGRNFIQMCGTTPCMLRGSDDIKAVLMRRVGAEREVSPDGAFSWLEVECLGACCNAPMVQINDDYYEDLTAENFEKLLDDLAAGRPVRKGSQTGRVTSEPAGGLTSLTSLYGVDGRSGPGCVSAGGQSAPDHAAAASEHARQDQKPAEPAAARLAQEVAESPGKPRQPVAESPRERTEVPVGEHGQRADAAQQPRVGSVQQGVPADHPAKSAPADSSKTS
ncbi:MAG: NADH-quinone oxidoreductase subunit NuoE [Beijerinckiaceae bacterium]|nr:NADH-quinone oxidoreductase subunit NuoE [Beijerinckiaceae bacterium]